MSTDSAFAVILSRAPRVLLVKNKRGGWGLPGGGIERGETPVAAVLREVEEETGLRARRASYVGSFRRSRRRIHLFVVRKKKTKGSLRGETAEVMKQRWVRPEDALRLLTDWKASRLEEALRLVSGD